MSHHCGSGKQLLYSTQSLFTNYQQVIPYYVSFLVIPNPCLIYIIMYVILKIYKLQQIFRPRIISDTSTSEKLYDREIKMYFYLANVGFEPTPTLTAAPSNTETTVMATTLHNNVRVYIVSSLH